MGYVLIKMNGLTPTAIKLTKNVSAVKMGKLLKNI